VSSTWTAAESSICDRSSGADQDRGFGDDVTILVVQPTAHPPQTKAPRTHSLASTRMPYLLAQMLMSNLAKVYLDVNRRKPRCPFSHYFLGSEDFPLCRSSWISDGVHRSRRNIVYLLVFLLKGLLAWVCAATSGRLAGEKSIAFHTASRSGRDDYAGRVKISLDGV
jgi:hypothetical protein